MNDESVRSLLQAVAAGSCTVEEALRNLRGMPFEELGFATVDHHRGLRIGFPEVVLGSCKSVEQIVGILDELGKHGDNVLVTRVQEDKAALVCALRPHLEHHQQAKALVWRQRAITDRGRGRILVVTAGTGDIPAAEEACLTAELMGNQVDRLFDVGVAGIHRIISNRKKLEAATVIIVVAGMEGALPSVVGGLVARPIVAVPTSVGYGTSMQGLAALLGMLNSCAAGVTVVNIDNGFGAGFAASLINRKVLEP